MLGDIPVPPQFSYVARRSHGPGGRTAGTGTKVQMARPTLSSYVNRRIVVAVVCVSARRLRLLCRLPMAILRGTPGGPTPSPERTHMPRPGCRAELREVDLVRGA